MLCIEDSTFNGVISSIPLHLRKLFQFCVLYIHYNRKHLMKFNCDYFNSATEYICLIQSLPVTSALQASTLKVQLL